MKIKIIKCEDLDSWYTHLVGEEFEVKECSETRVKVIEAGNYHYFEIFKLDAELIEEPTGEHKTYDGKVKLIYIACAFNAPTDFETQLNVTAARRAGYQIAKLGFYPVMPTVNTSGFQAANDVNFWYEATMELMRRCDAVYVVDGWHNSSGVKGEIDEAKRLEIPVYFSMKKLIDSFVNKEYNNSSKQTTGK